MLPASKHFTPVVGLDIHIVTLPPGVPTPLPHPFIGLVMDVANYIPFVGSTVNVNGVPRGTTFTSGMLGIFVHIPMGGPFVMAPMIGHDAYGFFGSMKTKAEGELFSPAGYMCMSCNDIGMPLSLTPGPKMKPIPSLYLPTSVSIPIPMGPPVIVGGPYVPDLMGLLMSLVMSYGMGALMKGIGKGLKAFNKLLKKAFGESNKLSKLLCKWGFEPVNLITGEVLYDGTDFELPGPIPIKWERAWYSFSSYEGALGHGQHLAYDLPLVEDAPGGAVALMLPDGRAVAFPPPGDGGASYNRTEKVTLRRKGGAYEVEHHGPGHTYAYVQVAPGTFKPATLTDRRGFQVRFGYTPQGHLGRLTDAVGREVRLGLDARGRITQVSVHHDGRGQVKASYRYDGAGNLIGIADALGKETVMEFEGNRMVRKTDRNGMAFHWEYDGQGRCTHTWGDGGVLEGWIEYREGHNLVTDSLGRTSVYYFDGNNLCTQIKDPLGNSRFFEYTDDLELYREIDEEGRLTGYTYDERGNRTGVFLPDGGERRFFYDKDDRPVMAVDAGGGTTVYTYNKDGLVKAIAAPGNSVTAFEYDAHRRVAAVVSPDGALTRLVYDKDQNLAEMHLPGGGKAAWTYDAWGNCLSARNPGAQRQHFQFDPLGRVTQVRLPDSNVIHLSYNAYDEVVGMVDRHRRVEFGYTPLGSLKMREENGVKVGFDYDTEERLRGIRNEHGEAYLFGRDAAGRIVRETGFDGITRLYNRDRAGKVVKVDRAGDRWTEYEHDLGGRITRAVHFDGTWETYSYDRDGRLIEAVNGNATVRIRRDAGGRVVEEWQDGHKVQSRHNPAGLRTHIASSLGAGIVIDRDPLGNVGGMSASVDGSEAWEARILRDALGREVERALTGGVVATWAYDAAGLPAAHGVAARGRETRRRAYRWDVNSRLTSIVDGLAGGIVNFGHDAFGGLAWAQYETGAFDYKLPDEVGNLFKAKDRKDRRYGEGGRLLECPDYTYAYDAEGNLTSRLGKIDLKRWDYHWQGNGMLREVVRPDRKAVSFEYDALGRRTAKIFDGMATRWVWDGNTPLHEWCYPAADRPRMVVDGLGGMGWSHPESVPAVGLTTWVFDEGRFSPAAKIVGGRRFSIITDHLGTPVQMYDESGGLTWDAEYDIYGNIRRLTVGSLNDCPFRYPGQYADQETGLYYNRFRYYSPESGGYLSQDPIGLAGAMPNFYSYVNDSTVRIDPLGLINPLDIAFSQNSISDVLTEGPRAGESIFDLIQEAKELGRLPDGLRLEVMELNGGRDIVTMNNRTLYIAQQAGLEQVHPKFVDNINKLNKLLDGHLPLELGELPEIKCKK